MLSLYAIPSSSVLMEYDANFDVVIPFEELRLPENDEVCMKKVQKRYFSSWFPFYLTQITAAIRKFYFGDSPIDENQLVNFYEYLSDLNFINATDYAVKQHVTYSKGNTYYAWWVLSTD